MDAGTLKRASSVRAIAIYTARRYCCTLQVMFAFAASCKAMKQSIVVEVLRTEKGGNVGGMG